MTKACNVPLDEPSWWYNERTSPLVYVLRLPAWIYGTVARHRLRRPAQSRLRLPVICIGNFTVGGTGKTPLAITVADLLRTAGRRPVFLSRGYGGRLTGPHIVSVSGDKAVDVGDEPLLLAAHGPTVIARDRVAGGEFIVIQALGDVVIMDDGLQNPSLHKDYALAVVDRRRNLGNGLVIPAGPLRAPLADQLAKVDGIVINHGATSDPLQHGARPDWLPSDYHGDLFQITTEPQGDISWLPSARLVAYAGIANPGRFFDMLRQLGGEVLATHTFRDHHSFTDNDVEMLLNAADTVGGQLVTTAKDMVRLAGRVGPAVQLRERSRVLSIGAVLSDIDERRLSTALLRAIAAAG
ncbi:MAG: tetraacyldisaccharide 4'-kinase [Hyphomicrobiaceae bacterium]